MLENGVTVILIALLRARALITPLRVAEIRV
jgi:hypothetical protein